MKNKAFTLVELLGVIIILGVIGLIVTFTVSNVLRDSRKSLCQSQLDSMIEATKVYIGQDTSKLPATGSSSMVTLGELIDSGLIETQYDEENNNYYVVNPETEQPFPDDLTIKVSKNGNKMKFEVLDINTYCKE